MLIDKICPVCQINFKDRKNTKRPKITCSRNCSNKLFPRRKSIYPKTFVCQYCSNITPWCHSSRNKFCSSKCRSKSLTDSAKTRFNDGNVQYRNTLRKFIAEAIGYKCNVCGISDWNKKTLTLQVNHIDGDASNNKPDNLELICPNCHTQTDTYSGRNKGSGRKSRGLPLN